MKRAPRRSPPGCRLPPPPTPPRPLHLAGESARSPSRPAYTACPRRGYSRMTRGKVGAERGRRWVLKSLLDRGEDCLNVGFRSSATGPTGRGPARQLRPVLAGVPPRRAWVAPPAVEGVAEGAGERPPALEGNGTRRPPPPTLYSPHEPWSSGPPCVLDFRPMYRPSQPCFSASMFHTCAPCPAGARPNILEGRRTWSGLVPPVGHPMSPAAPQSPRRGRRGPEQQSRPNAS